ncbi:putative SAM-dependent methyltransferase [Nitrospira sp. KM1]|uniref:class I SAM-dependent methyltransferase n=1 Tax=Nitrospira sp. KM1 TaxID=1936990 RepID=UPI0013A7510D|nr:class I SAM-dependent methyltransferase [Nitrospira sp. KM1]BCA54236.1 putative SAM-dependent methyltransferase [Nitrospira sp. KM1]
MTAHLETMCCDLCRSSESDVILRLPDLLLRVTDEVFTIVRCRKCGLAYLNPRPTQAAIGTYYPTVYYPPVTDKGGSTRTRQSKRLSSRIKQWVLEGYYGYPSRAHGAWRAIRKLLLWPEKAWREIKGRRPFPWRGEGRVLDVGCGAGGNLRTLEEQGWRVAGIEISPVAAEHARALVTGPIHTGTLETAPFSAGSFDLVLMSHSLEHLPSPVDALGRVHRLLADGGLLIVVVPNEQSFEARLFGRWWFHWDPPRHFYHFNRRTLSDALAHAGFRVEKIRTGVSSTFFMASLERLWNERFHKAIMWRRVVERVLAKPFCLMAGHMGFGTELTVYAEKSLSSNTRSKRSPDG